LLTAAVARQLLSVETASGLLDALRATPRLLAQLVKVDGLLHSPRRAGAIEAEAERQAETAARIRKTRLPQLRNH